MNRFPGHVAVVTGAASGIGWAIARAFDSEGAMVAILDVDGERAHDAAKQLRQATPYACDVSSPDDVAATIAEIGARFGHIDTVVNNAGIAGSLPEIKRRSESMERYTAELLETMAAPTAPVDITVQTTTDQWRRVFAVHVDGTFFVSREALKWMIPAGRGTIVNISSICGIIGCVGSPAYSAAKAAVIGFTRSLAKEVANRGIRVNAVAPGYVDTAISPVRSNLERSLTIASIPLGRLGAPEEIAESVLFLASDASSYYTGALLTPSGGCVS